MSTTADGAAVLPRIAIIRNPKACLLPASPPTPSSVLLVTVGGVGVRVACAGGGDTRVVGSAAIHSVSSSSSTCVGRLTGGTHPAFMRAASCSFSCRSRSASEEDEEDEEVDAEEEEVEEAVEDKDASPSIEDEAI